MTAASVTAKRMHKWPVSGCFCPPQTAGAPEPDGEQDSESMLWRLGWPTLLWGWGQETKKLFSLNFVHFIKRVLIFSVASLFLCLKKIVLSCFLKLVHVIFKGLQNHCFIEIWIWNSLNKWLHHDFPLHIFFLFPCSIIVKPILTPSCGRAWSVLLYVELCGIPWSS